jgi:hypothetical protein
VSGCPPSSREKKICPPEQECETVLTLTTIFQNDGYDDQITINPTMIRTMRIVVIGDGDDPDEGVICTEIDLGIIVTEDDGQIVSKPIYVSEPIEDIVTMIKHVSRLYR